MTKNLATVLEIGSSKLKITVAKEGLNDTFNIIDSAELAYDGYFEGEFVSFDKLQADLGKLCNEIDHLKKRYNKKLFVGIPSEFIGVEVVDVALNFDDYSKIKQSDIKDLYSVAIDKIATDAVEVISSSIISCSIDEGGRIIGSPVGKKGRQLSATVSIIVAEKETIQKLNNIFSELGFETVEYVSEALTEALEIIPEEEREHECLLVDVGHLSTSISFVKGDGLLSLTAYSIGGGNITGDICEKFALPFDEAEKLKRQSVMSIKGDINECYDLITEKGVKRFKLEEVNKIILSSVEVIGRAINQCVQSYSMQYIPFLPVYLTGSGLTKLKGGKDYLAKCIGRNIILGVPEVPGKDKPENSATFGLLRYAIKNL